MPTFCSTCRRAPHPSAAAGRHHGAEAVYAERFGTTFDERTVLKFLVADTANPCSMLSSLSLAERTPAPSATSSPARRGADERAVSFARTTFLGTLQTRALRYLKHIILWTQTLAGMLAGTMNNDAGYDFLRIGRNLERAT